MTADTNEAMNALTDEQLEAHFRAGWLEKLLEDGDSRPTGMGIHLDSLTADPAQHPGEDRFVAAMNRATASLISDGLVETTPVFRGHLMRLTEAGVEKAMPALIENILSNIFSGQLPTD